MWNKDWKKGEDYPSWGETDVYKKTISEIREEPGMSNAGKYKDVPADDFAGPHGTYPINTEARGKSAIKLAHNAADPAAIKAKVYAKYPELKPEVGVQAPDNKSKTA